MLEVQLTHTETVAELQRKFGGTLYYHTPRNLKAKPFCKWTVGPKALREILPRTYPFLVTKSLQACLMLEYLDLRSLSRNYGAHNPERQEEIKCQMKGLNRRGT